AVGSNSVVGQTVEKGRAFITLDTTHSDVPWRFNPILPQTRSEMALPLRFGNVVIGAVDIQSIEQNAFSQDDIQIFEVLADQLAIAINNARLLAETEGRVKQIADLNRQLTRTAWTEFVKDEKSEELAFSYDLNEIKSGEATPDGSVSVDITVRGEAVGKLSV